jgi:hypothetical protein
MRSQQFPGFDAEGAAQLFQFVDARGHHRAAYSIERAVADAAARRDLGQRVQIGPRRHQRSQIDCQNVTWPHVHSVSKMVYRDREKSDPV